jgi:hypothetical protein
LAEGEAIPLGERILHCQRSAFDNNFSRTSPKKHTVFYLHNHIPETREYADSSGAADHRFYVDVFT